MPAPSLHGVPLEPDQRAPLSSQFSRSWPSSRSSSNRATTSRVVLEHVTPLEPSFMKLPPHIEQEAKMFRAAARTDNPLTELQARPLIKSTAIWLMQNGTINKEDSPGVIQMAGDLLHKCIPLHFCQARARISHPLPTPLASPPPRPASPPPRPASPPPRSASPPPRPASGAQRQDACGRLRAKDIRFLSEPRDARQQGFHSRGSA